MIFVTVTPSRSSLSEGPESLNSAADSEAEVLRSWTWIVASAVFTGKLNFFIALRLARRRACSSVTVDGSPSLAAALSNLKFSFRPDSDDSDPAPPWLRLAPLDPSSSWPDSEGLLGSHCSIWNPVHLDRIRQIGTAQYVLVHTSTWLYMTVHDSTRILHFYETVRTGTFWYVLEKQHVAFWPNQKEKREIN
jgi:hypothetical protein